MNWSLLIGILSGLAFLGGSPDFQTLRNTAIVINIANAFLCRVIALRSGRNGGGWMLAGLIFGVWALMTLLFLTRRQPSEPAKS